MILHMKEVACPKKPLLRWMIKIFIRKGLVLNMYFLQDFMAAYEACNKVQRFRRMALQALLLASVLSVIKANVALSIKVSDA